MGCTTAIIGWNVFVCFLFTCVVRVGGQDEPIINKGAIVGQPLVLPCGLPQAKRAPPVTWVDFVHNLDEDPITIFDGTNVVANHPKAERYSVGSNYSLTISNVSDSDPGEYVCRSKVGRTVNSASYIVLVADLPKCVGETSMEEGDNLLLTCTTNYWGSEQPDVRWFRGNEPVTDIIDRSVISEAQYIVDTKARWQDDKLSYQCRVSVDGLAAHCEKIISVTYTVRNIQVGPESSTSVAADDYVTCSAKGNPEPEVTLTLKAMGLTQKGRGTQRILVANSWVGKNMTFDCEARNTVPGQDETVIASTVTLYMRVSDLKAASAGAGDSMYGIIIGIAIGVLAVIVIIVAVICLRRRKQQDKKVAGGKNGTDTRKMEDGRRAGGSEEKQPLTANHEVSVNGEKARYSPTKA